MSEVNGPKIEFLGQIAYDSAVTLQLEERQRVKDGVSSGTIFFLEHNPAVITLGRNALVSNMLFPKKLLENKGYHVREVSRGGDVTVHEPGQLVVYFVMPLKSKAVRGFVDGIVNSIRACLRDDFGLEADFDPQKPGLWVMDADSQAGGGVAAKICSIGFDLTQKVSMHGIALNVCNSLEGFSLIVPCGLSGVKMTTMSRVLGKTVGVEEVAQKLSLRFK